MSLSYALNTWSAHVLGRRDVTFSSLEDFSSGILFVELFQELSGVHINRWFPFARTDQEKLWNINFTARELAGTTEVLLDSQGILSGNLVHIEEMLWSLAYKYELSQITESRLHGFPAVQKWTDDTLSPLGFTPLKSVTEWENGQAFAALLSELRPKLLDFDEVRNCDQKYILNTVFSKAQSAGVPRMLDVEEILEGKLCKKALYLYLGLWRKHFGKSQRRARKSQPCLHDSKVTWEARGNNFLHRLEEVNTWIEDETADTLMKRRNHEEVESALDQVRRFQSEELPLKINELEWLESEAENLDRRSKLIGLRFAPPKALSIPKLLHLLNTVEKEVQGFEIILVEEKAGFEAADTKQFHHGNELDELESSLKEMLAWIKGKHSLRTTSIHVIRQIQAELSAFREQHDVLIESFNEMKKYGSLNKDMPERYEKLQELSLRFCKKADHLDSVLEKLIRDLANITQKCINFAKRMEEANRQQQHIFYSIKHGTYTNLEQQVNEHGLVLKELEQEEHSISCSGEEVLEYSRFTVQDLRAGFEQLELLVNLELNANEQLGNQELLSAFEEPVRDFKCLLEEQQRALVEVSKLSQGDRDQWATQVEASLQEKAASIHKLFEAVSGTNHHPDSVLEVDTRKDKFLRKLACVLEKEKALDSIVGQEHEEDLRAMAEVFYTLTGGTMVMEKLPSAQSLQLLGLKAADLVAVEYPITLATLLGITTKSMEMGEQHAKEQQEESEH